MLRNFLAEGLAARQPCSWAAPSSLSEDQLWLPQQSAQQSAQQKQSSQPGQSSAAANGLPQQPACSSAPSDGVQDESSPGQQQDHLRIAWQYRRYMVGRADAAHAPHPAHSRASQCVFIDITKSLNNQIAMTNGRAFCAALALGVFLGDSWTCSRHKFGVQSRRSPANSRSACEKVFSSFQVPLNRQSICTGTTERCRLCLRWQQPPQLQAGATASTSADRSRLQRRRQA